LQIKWRNKPTILPKKGKQAKKEEPVEGKIELVVHVL
jgi:hypothetical protein